ncbi:MAG: hypothetical protein RIF33_06530 [Cyclobacteriaceae bacterium]
MDSILMKDTRLYQVRSNALHYLVRIPLIVIIGVFLLSYLFIDWGDSNDLIISSIILIVGTMISSGIIQMFRWNIFLQRVIYKVIVSNGRIKVFRRWYHFDKIRMKVILRSRNFVLPKSFSVEVSKVADEFKLHVDGSKAFTILDPQISKRLLDVKIKPTN